MANEFKSPALTTDIITLVKEQITMMQQSFTDALAQQQAILEAQYQQLIDAIHEKLRNIKALTLKTLISTPPADEIKITIFKLSPLNANLKLIIVT